MSPPRKPASGQLFNKLMYQALVSRGSPSKQAALMANYTPPKVSSAQTAAYKRTVAANARNKATAAPASARPKKPSFDTALKAATGDKKAKAAVSLYERSRGAQKQGARQARTMQDKALFGKATPTVYKSASRTGAPVATAIIKAVSPVEAAKVAYKEGRKGHIGSAGVAALGVIPFGPTKAGRVGQAVEEGVVAARAASRARRTLQVGEKVQQIPHSRSRLTTHVIERPADYVSQALPGVPYAGAHARVAKHAGWAANEELRRATAWATTHAKALPKEGSPEDVAHFWWAQVPAEHRNVATLVAIRDKQIASLKRAAGPERVAQLVSRHAKIKLAGLPENARVTGASINQLNEVIANPPKLDNKIIQAVHALSGDRKATLQSVELLNPERAIAREGLVSGWLGLKPGGEAFVGHRMSRPGGIPGSHGLRSIGLGKPRKPMGVSKENKLVLAAQGSLRQSTHVAAEDWGASVTYKRSLAARKDLADMGAPFEGHLPEGHMLVNPSGKVVPAAWKTDQIAKAQHAGNPDEVRQAAEQAAQSYLGDAVNWEQVVEEAKATGSFDKLRVVPEAVVHRYYNQILPVGRATRGGRLYDHLLDATSASIVFGRLGYVPKNVVQNLVISLPHQGALFLANAPRAASLIPRPGRSGLDKEVWDLIASEVGGGVAGSIAAETTAKTIVGKPAQVMTGLADIPARVTAFLHEASAEGVIPRLMPYLRDQDKKALLDLLKNPAKRAQLDDIMHRTRDAMGDFNRLNPVQRRWLRRFLLVPGWLYAGTRYPIHFAATHPVRSAALGYLAAGEPGAPKQAQVNKPIDEYLTKGFPSYVQSVSAEHWPGALGGGQNKQFRVSSLLPGSLPFDAANAAKHGKVLSAADYVNPLPVAAWNVGTHTYQTPSGESKTTTYLDALKRAGTRLAPGEQFLQNEARPPSGENRMYPDQSRLGILKKEAGIVPVTIDPVAAKRAAYGEKGMTGSAQSVDDKAALFKEIKAAGLEPSKHLLAAYDLQLQRRERLDKIHLGGARHLAYQQKAYESSVKLLVKLGRLTPKEGRATVAASKLQDEATLKSWNSWLTRNKFDGDVITDVKTYLKEQKNP